MKRFLFKLFGLDKEIEQLIKLHGDFSVHVFSNAKFMDRQGLSDQNYNSDDVEAHWQKFHELDRDIFQKLNRIR